MVCYNQPPLTWKICVGEVLLFCKINTECSILSAVLMFGGIYYNTTQPKIYQNKCY